jgi:pre-mRNA-splicing factor ISY1
VDLYKNITPDYYGFRDDDDGILKGKEAERELEWIEEAEAEYSATAHNLKLDENDDDEEDVVMILNDHNNKINNPSNAKVPMSMSVTVDIPSAESIADFIIDQKKQNLLELYQ